MNHRELDCLIIGFSVGALAFLWLGYKLRQRVERWHARREQRTHQCGFHKMTGRTAGDIAARAEQDARQVMQRQKIIPLKRDPNTGRTRDMSRKHLLEVTQLTEPEAEKLTEEWRDAWPAVADHTVREEALVCLTGAGYKRAVAEAALDACTPLDRAGGLEHWVAAALRQAVAKP